MAFLNFAVGAYTMVPLVELVESTTCAVFICFARHPEILDGTHPELFIELNDAYEVRLT